jgi:hypothetical protein
MLGKFAFIVVGTIGLGLSAIPGEATPALGGISKIGGQFTPVRSECFCVRKPSGVVRCGFVDRYGRFIDASCGGGWRDDDDDYRGRREYRRGW